MIRVLNSSLELQAILTNIISANRFEEINGENTLAFSAILDAKTSTYIDENTVFELNDDYFDIAYFKKDIIADGTRNIEVEAEHISYRLNNPDYDKEYFTVIGTPTEILTAILNGTGFSVGTVDYTETMTYSAQEKKSARRLLMELIALLGGELLCNKFEISIVAHRGNTEPKIYTTSRNINIVSKIYNKRETDSSGNPLVSYICKPIEIADMPLSLGDEIKLIQAELGINSQMRVVRHGYNPYDLRDSEIELANYVSTIEDQLYRIETNTVSKDKFYHGCRIGPEHGFECIRSDKKARAYLNSTNLALQAGDGSGNNWKDKLYYDLNPETGEAELFFAGKFEVDSVVSNTTITQVLYATEGKVARLTVDKLLSGNPIAGTPQILFQSIQGQYHKFIVGTRRDDLDQVQYTDEADKPLYWDSAEQLYMTTTNTGLAVMVYVYDLTTKLEMNFEEDDNGVMVPKIILGAGAGVVGHPEYGKGYIYKETDGLLLRYIKANGSVLDIKLGEDGLVFPNNLESVDFYSNGFSATYDGNEVAYTWTKDFEGKITSLTAADSTVIAITWNASEM